MYLCLNPYSTGNEVVGNFYTKSKSLKDNCLNPYSTGNEVVGLDEQGFEFHGTVLILILLEMRLLDCNNLSKMGPWAKSLNPYSTGNEVVGFYFLQVC